MAFVLAGRVLSNAVVLNNTKYVGSLCANFLSRFRLARELIFVVLESFELYVDGAYNGDPSMDFGLKADPGALWAFCFEPMRRVSLA